MRLKVTAKSTAIGPVNLYWEDFAKLVALFKSYCETVEISDDKATYESLDEAAGKIDGKITNIDILGKNPNIRLTLKNTGSWLAQQFDKPGMPQSELDQLDLVYIRVKEFLDKRKLLRSDLFSPLSLLVVMITVIGVGATLLVRVAVVYRAYVLLVAWVVVAAWAAATKTFRNVIGTVSLKPKASVTTFWSRKKDDLIMLVIGLVLGGIIGHFLK